MRDQDFALEMKYEIKDGFGGVPEGSKYVIEDTPETEKEWRALFSAFSKAFVEFTSVESHDYELPDWHHGMRALFVYLYNERFYDERFLPKVQRILEAQKYDSFAQFECYDSSKRLIGRLMILKDKVIFDRISEQTGLLKKLIDVEN